MYYYPKKRIFMLDPSEVSSPSLERILYHYQATCLVEGLEKVKAAWDLNKVPILVGTDKDISVWKKNVQYGNMVMKIPKEATCFEQSENDVFIEFCHSQGVECGEYITGKKHYGGRDDCFLCDIAKGLGLWSETRVEYNRTISKASHMVLFETDNYIVKVELGCLIPGMLMICTKEHHMSAACIPDDQFEEYLQICRDIEYLLKNIYGDVPVVFFEHGSAYDGGSSHARAIVHQHTHVIVGLRMDREDMQRVGMRKINDIREVRGKKYLSYQEGVDGQLWVADHQGEFIPRQYPRKVFACKLGISYEDSNWRIEPFWENIFKTFEDIYNYLSENWGKLPSRIQNAMRAFYIAYPLREKDI